MDGWIKWLTQHGLGPIGIILASLAYSIESARIHKDKGNKNTIVGFVLNIIRSMVSGGAAYSAAYFLTPLEAESAWGIAIVITFMGPTWIRGIGKTVVELVLTKGVNK